MVTTISWAAMQLIWFSCWDFAVRLDLWCNCGDWRCNAESASARARDLGYSHIVFSAVSFVGMGGFFIGAILGIIGGAFALSFRQINP